MFGFPPENIVTLVAPGFFGDMQQVPYWGRCYLWEMCLYFSVAGLVLAVYGAVHGRLAHKRAVLVTLAVALLLAMGKTTPLFRLLYALAPGLDQSRHVRMHGAEDGKPARKTQGIPVLKSPRASAAHGFGAGVGG